MPRVLFSKAAYTRNQFDHLQFTGEPVTPNDSADLPSGACIAIYVTGAGNVNVNLAGGGTAVLTGLSAGQTVYVNATRIKATSTTATGIFALYRAGNY
jgi:hypothetical protein